MRLNKIKDWHWRILSKKDITLFEFIIGLKRVFKDKGGELWQNNTTK